MIKMQTNINAQHAGQQLLSLTYSPPLLLGGDVSPRAAVHVSRCRQKISNELIHCTVEREHV